MKNIILIGLLFPALVYASEPEATAVKFNQWYMSQLQHDKTPLTDYEGLAPYVTAKTISDLKTMYSGDSEDKDVADADMFIKSQDFDADWNIVSVVSSELDPVCTHVYVAFGKDKKHVVADCFVQENGVWKIQSVTNISPSF